jgi:hypothetical protein
MSDIKKITSAEFTDIILSEKNGKYEPLGLFYLKEKDSNVYVGVDNSSGYAWTEDFKSLSACKHWLKN